MQITLWTLGNIKKCNAQYSPYERIRNRKLK